MTLGMKTNEEASNKILCNTIRLERVPSKHEVMGSNPTKAIGEVRKSIES